MHRDKSVRPRPLSVYAFRWLLTALLLSMPSSPALAGAPELDLKDLSGKNRNIDEYIGRGHWVILVVWSADCPICRREMYQMTFLHEEHKDKGTRVLGLSIDGYVQRDKVQDFADEQSLNFPTLIGDRADASRLSGLPFRGTPTYYFFAPDGRFMTARLGALTQGQAERIVEALKKGRSPP